MTVFVETRGEGPELVLLHGWGLHGGIFDLLVPKLETRFTLHVVDLPGFGHSSALAGDFSLPSLARAVRAVVPARAHYLGWSLGGMVAMQMAIETPECVDRLITIASNPKFRASADWPHAMKDSVLDAFTSSLADDYRQTLNRFLGIASMGSPTQKDDVRILKESVFVRGEPSRDTLTHGLNVLHDADLRPQLARIRAPFLRIYGQLDALVPAKVAPDVQALLPQSAHVVYRHASHAPFISHRDSVAALVTDFLLDHRVPEQIEQALVSLAGSAAHG